MVEYGKYSNDLYELQVSVVTAMGVGGGVRCLQVSEVSGPAAVLTLVRKCVIFTSEFFNILEMLCILKRETITYQQENIQTFSVMERIVCVVVFCPRFL